MSNTITIAFAAKDRDLIYSVLEGWIKSARFVNITPRSITFKDVNDAIMTASFFQDTFEKIDRRAWDGPISIRTQVTI